MMAPAVLLALASGLVTDAYGQTVATSFDFPLTPWTRSQGFGLNFWNPATCGYHLAEDVPREYGGTCIRGSRWRR